MAAAAAVVLAAKSSTANSMGERVGASHVTRHNVKHCSDRVSSDSLHALGLCALAAAGAGASASPKSAPVYLMPLMSSDDKPVSSTISCKGRPNDRKLQGGHGQQSDAVESFD